MAFLLFFFLPFPPLPPLPFLEPPFLELLLLEEEVLEDVPLEEADPLEAVLCGSLEEPEADLDAVLDELCELLLGLSS